VFSHAVVFVVLFIVRFVVLTGRCAVFSRLVPIGAVVPPVAFVTSSR
jgi:hypothetical protein